MKNQYLGDRNDYRNYGLLRTLQSSWTGRVLVAWMLTPDDGGRDGGTAVTSMIPARGRSTTPTCMRVWLVCSARPHGPLYHSAKVPRSFRGRATTRRWSPTNVRIVTSGATTCFALLTVASLCLSIPTMAERCLRDLSVGRGPPSTSRGRRSRRFRGSVARS